MAKREIIKNKSKSVGGFDLEITYTGTVYNTSKKGSTKLKALFDKNIGAMVIELPNKEIVKLFPLKGLLLTELEFENMKRLSRC